jgi:putative peptidoglycan lipid II flippase
MVGHALVAYGVGLIGLILVKILAPGFYASRISAPLCSSPWAC